MANITLLNVVQSCIYILIGSRLITCTVTSRFAQMRRLPVFNSGTRNVLLDERPDWSKQTVHRDSDAEQAFNRPPFDEQRSFTQFAGLPLQVDPALDAFYQPSEGTDGTMSKRSNAEASLTNSYPSNSRIASGRSPASRQYTFFQLQPRRHVAEASIDEEAVPVSTITHFQPRLADDRKVNTMKRSASAFRRMQDVDSVPPTSLSNGDICPGPIFRAKMLWQTSETHAYEFLIPAKTQMASAHRMIVPVMTRSTYSAVLIRATLVGNGHSQAQTDIACGEMQYMIDSTSPPHNTSLTLDLTCTLNIDMGVDRDQVLRVHAAFYCGQSLTPCTERNVPVVKESILQAYWPCHQDNFSDQRRTNYRKYVIY